MIAVSCLAAAAVAVDTAAWAYACRRLDDGARISAAAAGWQLSAGAGHWRGWPAAAEVSYSGATLRSGPEIIPPLTWTAGRLALRLSALNPTILTVTAAGPQTVAIGGAPPTPITADTLNARIDLTQPDPVRVEATGFATAGPVTAASATLLLSSGSVTANLTGLAFPDGNGRAIDPQIAALRFDGRLSPPIEPMPTAAESARAWRASDGRLSLENIVLKWGALDATARATVTLDPALQPAVTGQISATGLGGVLDQLVATGALTSSGATAVRGMLAILSAPSGGGPVTVPVGVRDGVISLARIPVLRLAPLEWD